MTLYDLKPRFQALLRPLLKRLFRAGITANQVTLAALIASVAIGLLLFFYPHPALFLILPIFLFIRMALNAIDGLLAREYNQKSKLGALLNETGDVISDAALYLPFALLPGATPWLVLLAVLLSILTEFCGVLAQTIGASRRYDGPMGKSDRALIFGAYALAIFIWPVCMEWSWILFSLVSVLLVWTCLNRCCRALAEVNS
ncbi:CDP-alcohol phosphatidyltransferase family protein [Jinshanibacter sp. LJY008]|uniref:CDP-alcohol phosphatidyltransferase family protein n=1 Tax=Limnobaculum eriocheiris TaxID=2897391 RepID=A0A9X1MWK2_9GAMM|nr:CDP-alcohol phosphatidyltransferase family protein [Limnobaculum eriocheiris]MCD1126881.1 CDP-alcohol phosphatidyltransferase family protein [Limnobaculum eriocheiris]